MDFGKIREARKSAQITQEQLAKQLGINRATLSKYEKGIIEPSISQITKIAALLNIDWTDLVPTSDVEKAVEDYESFKYGEVMESIYGPTNKEECNALIKYLKSIGYSLISKNDTPSKSLSHSYVLINTETKKKYFCSETDIKFMCDAIRNDVRVLIQVIFEE